MTPDRLTGKAFESAIVDVGARYERAGTMSIGRFGTIVVLVNGAWMPRPSLPDFDCVLQGGRQVVIEAKAVTSARLLDFQKSKLKPRQVDYLLRRARMGSLCFLAVHYAGRPAGKRTPAVRPLTVLVPVLPSELRWVNFVKTQHGEGLSPESALAMGTEIEWTAEGRSKKELPDILGAVKRLTHLFDDATTTGHIGHAGGGAADSLAAGPDH